MKTKVLISAFLVIVAAFFAFNNFKTDLTGKIQDYEGMGIMFSSLEIYTNDENQKLIQSTYTDVDGSFEMKNLRPGEYKLIVSTPGFEKKVQTFKLNRKSKNNIGTIKIDGNVITLPALVIFG